MYFKHTEMNNHITLLKLKHQNAQTHYYYRHIPIILIVCFLKYINYLS